MLWHYPVIILDKIDISNCYACTTQFMLIGIGSFCQLYIKSGDLKIMTSYRVMALLTKFIGGS